MSAAQRSMVVSPGLAAFAAGYDVVPVATYEAYGRAVAVVRRVAADIAAVTSRRGPLVPPSRHDVWLDSSALIGQVVMPNAIALGGFGSILLLPAMALQSGPSASPLLDAACWALGGSCFAALLAGIYMRRADVRIAKHKARVGQKRFEVQDVDAMLASFVAAPANVRSNARAAIRLHMERLRPLMNAAAVERLDTLLIGSDAPDQSVSDVAFLAAQLLASPSHPSGPEHIERLLARAGNPTERQVIADELNALIDAKKSA